MSAPLHPCLRCGVCCQQFRVEFSVYELASMGGSVPDALTHAVNGNRCRMNGTAERPVRCVAFGPLPAVADEAVGCTIYESRSSTCRDFAFASDRCNETRQLFGKPVMTEEELLLWLPQAQLRTHLDDNLEQAAVLR